MQMKIIGAILIVVGCGGFGLSMAAAYRKEVSKLRQLIGALDYMECELQYRLTPLPQLCRQTAGECSGSLRTLFTALTRELEDQISPDVARCVAAAMSVCKDMPPVTAQCLQLLGRSLGRFDLEGQLKGLDSVRRTCRGKLDELEHNKDIRLRSYQTLGLCAGAALAILLV